MDVQLRVKRRRLEEVCIMVIIRDSFFRDKSRSYTRNLVDEGNGHYNLMIICWNEGRSRYCHYGLISSPIHDHSGSHCLMKVIDGELTETIYSWPTKMKNDVGCGSDSEKDFDQKVPWGQCMKVSTEKTLPCNQVTYISDAMGIHRVGNMTDRPAVSLHLYTPPYSTCHLFDEQTGNCHPSAKCNFFSKNGQVLP